MKIEELGLSAKAYHVLQNAKINTVEQLREALYNPFVKIGSIGSSVFNEIQEKLAAHTLTNAERFRNMTDEEQQRFVRGFFEIEDFADWLKQPAKEEA